MEERRIEIAKWLNSNGYSFAIEPDGLFMEDYGFTEHRNKDVFDLLEEYAVFQTTKRIPNSYLLSYDDPRDMEISAVATLFKDKKPIRWAIRKGGSCMSKKDGLFAYGPQPSSRDESYFDEFRFESFDDAERSYFHFHSA